MMPRRLTVLITLHAATIIGIAACVAATVYLAPWYIAVPVVHFELQQAFGGRCPLTVLENRLRRRRGLPVVRDFIGHYVFGRYQRRRRTTKG